MELNGTLIGQIIFVLTLVVVFFTLRFAKGKTTNLPLVGFYALVLNLIFAPAGGYIAGTGQPNRFYPNKFKLKKKRTQENHKQLG